MACYESEISVDRLHDSASRFVLHPTGARLQVVTADMQGYSRVSLHQNHYLTETTGGAHLGALEFYSRDQMLASVSAHVEGTRWSATNRPSMLVLRTTPADTTTPRTAVTISGDGRVLIGEREPYSQGVALGVYKRGTMVMPWVETAHELRELVSEPDGSITYVRGLGRVAVSQKGEWRLLMTEPLPSTEISERSSDLRTPGDV